MRLRENDILISTLLSLFKRIIGIFNQRSIQRNIQLNLNVCLKYYIIYTHILYTYHTQSFSFFSHVLKINLIQDKYLIYDRNSSFNKNSTLDLFLLAKLLAFSGFLSFSLIFKYISNFLFSFSSLKRNQL